MLDVHAPRRVPLQGGLDLVVAGRPRSVHDNNELNVGLRAVRQLHRANAAQQRDIDAKARHDDVDGDDRSRRSAAKPRLDVGAQTTAVVLQELATPARYVHALVSRRTRTADAVHKLDVHVERGRAPRTVERGEERIGVLAHEGVGEENTIERLEVESMHDRKRRERRKRHVAQTHAAKLLRKSLLLRGAREAALDRPHPRAAMRVARDGDVVAQQHKVAHSRVRCVCVLGHVPPHTTHAEHRLSMLGRDRMPLDEELHRRCSGTQVGPLPHEHVVVVVRRDVHHRVAPAARNSLEHRAQPPHALVRRAAATARHRHEHCPGRRHAKRKLCEGRSCATKRSGTVFGVYRRVVWPLGRTGRARRRAASRADAVRELAAAALAGRRGRTRRARRRAASRADVVPLVAASVAKPLRRQASRNPEDEREALYIVRPRDMQRKDTHTTPLAPAYHSFSLLPVARSHCPTHRAAKRTPRAGTTSHTRRWRETTSDNTSQPKPEPQPRARQPCEPPGGPGFGSLAAVAASLRSPPLAASIALTRRMNEPHPKPAPAMLRRRDPRVRYLPPRILPGCNSTCSTC
jgi:hypothetical protein